MQQDWLTKKVTLEELEQPTSEESGSSPFGHMNYRWLEIKSQMLPGDELWRFSSPMPTWQLLMGRAGISLVRDGEIVDSMILMMN